MRATGMQTELPDETATEASKYAAKKPDPVAPSVPNIKMYMIEQVAPVL